MEKILHVKKPLMKMVSSCGSYSYNGIRVFRTMSGKSNMISLKAKIPTFTWSILQQISITEVRQSNILRTSAGVSGTPAAGILTNTLDLSICVLISWFTTSLKGHVELPWIQLNTGQITDTKHFTRLTFMTGRYIMQFCLHTIDMLFSFWVPKHMAGQ